MCGYDDIKMDLGYTWLRLSSLAEAGSCGDGIEPSGSLKRAEFIE